MDVWPLLGETGKVADSKEVAEIFNNLNCIYQPWLVGEGGTSGLEDIQFQLGKVETRLREAQAQSTLQT